VAVERALRLVGAEPLATRPISELSNGERQKIMIARALAQEPAVMILDEVTAFLDLPRRVEMTHILQRLAHDHGCAILLSTHDLDTPPTPCGSRPRDGLGPPIQITASPDACSTRS
jgi:iron complex transport system ATP-binding protein